MKKPAPDAARQKSAKTLKPSPTRPAGNVLADGASALKDRVVISLLFRGVISPAQVQRVVAANGAGPDGPEGVLWRRLAEEPDLDREEIFSEAARIYAFNEADISQVAATTFIRANLDKFSETQWERMRTLGVLPIAQTASDRRDQPRWTFATYDPLNPEVNTLLETMGSVSYQLVYLRESEIKALMEVAFPRRNTYLEQLQDNEYAFDLDTGVTNAPIDEQEIEAQIRHSALLTLFEAMLIEAVREGASDIHVRPNSQGHIDIKFRVDGRLRTWHTERRVYPEAFLAVVKDNAQGVDRFERQAAQDGFMQRSIDGLLIRFRVSVIPMSGHDQEHRLESVVLRVLDDRNTPASLHQLGLTQLALDHFEEAVSQPHGLVIITGPTGSGKTTTLHGALRSVVTPEVNALTVEDPVEYLLPGVVQVKLSHKLNLEGALRSILRHDPDIVMVGEMRDRETAELAIKLANTGHLTFSTLHTNDAPSAVSRLYKMDIEPFLIAYAINLVVAQRLVRVLCPDCKAPIDSVSPPLLHRLGLTDEEIATGTFFAPTLGGGCKTCKGQGYKGRRAVAEVFPFTEAVQAHVAEAGDSIDEGVLREIASAQGLPTLARAAIELAREGVTSIEEARRTVFLR